MKVIIVLIILMGVILCTDDDFQWLRMAAEKASRAPTASPGRVLQDATEQLSKATVSAGDFLKFGFAFILLK